MSRHHIGARTLCLVAGLSLLGAFTAGCGSALPDSVAARALLVSECEGDGGADRQVADAQSRCRSVDG